MALKTMFSMGAAQGPALAVVMKAIQAFLKNLEEETGTMMTANEERVGVNSWLVQQKATKRKSGVKLQ
jgi:hypothetical protein